MPVLRAVWQYPGAACVYSCGDPPENIYGPPEYAHVLVLVCPLFVYVGRSHTRSPNRLRLHVIDDKAGVWIYIRPVDVCLLGYESLCTIVSV